MTRKQLATAVLAILSLCFFLCVWRGEYLAPFEREAAPASMPVSVRELEQAWRQYNAFYGYPTTQPTTQPSK